MKKLDLLFWLLVALYIFYRFSNETKKQQTRKNPNTSEWQQPSGFPQEFELPFPSFPDLPQVEEKIEDIWVEPVNEPFESVVPRKQIEKPVRKRFAQKTDSSWGLREKRKSAKLNWLLHPNADVFVQGIVMQEVLGPPRVYRPFSLRQTQKLGFRAKP